MDDGQGQARAAYMKSPDYFLESGEPQVVDLVRGACPINTIVIQPNCVVKQCCITTKYKYCNYSKTVLDITAAYPWFRGVNYTVAGDPTAGFSLGEQWD